MKNRTRQSLYVFVFTLPVFLVPTPAQAVVAPYEWGCTEMIVDEQPVERCGLGYWRTLCGWNAGVEECETFFELIEDGDTPAGVSNVLFLPGIKGSRLYRPEPGCEESISACAVKLWEPYGNTVARQLFLAEDGRGIYDDVYARTGDVLSAALGKRFYASFITDLNELMISGIFGAGWRWEAGAYDWRLSLEDLVTRGEREDDRVYFNRTSDTPYLETQLRDLAVNSPTGKVTIIAHSNGGLVAKALVAKLGSEAAALVDTVIFVGVPHFGAPQALGALLFGHGEALPFDGCATARVVSELCSLLMDRPTARAFAEHAPMAYHLLPSREYFEAMRTRADDVVSHSLATFSGSSEYTAEQAAYGSALDTEAELHAFAAAQEGGRTKPPSTNVSLANVLSPSLLSYARTVHDSLDSWRAPAGINVHHIIGWGKETISGIEFYEEPSVLALFGAAIPRYRPLFHFEGDGVVPSISASGNTDESMNPIPVSLSGNLLTDFPSSNGGQYWVDLDGINAGSIGGGYGHGTLFEIDSVRQLLRDLIGAVAGADVSLPQHILAAEPATPPERSWIRIFLHSPLTLELYAREKHLGVTATGTFENEIPGATYDEFGDVKYISAPAGEHYTVVMRGYGTGHFSLDIQELSGANATTTTIAQVPVTPSLEARVELPAENPGATTVLLDRDGDGTADETIALVPGVVTSYVDEDVIPVVPAPPAPETTKRTTSSQSADSAEQVNGQTLGANQASGGVAGSALSLSSASTSAEEISLPDSQPTEVNVVEDAVVPGETVPAESYSSEKRTSVPIVIGLLIASAALGFLLLLFTAIRK